MNAEVPSHARSDVYQTITESIISAIEEGAGEFVMPWHGRGISRPQNAFTLMEYHGINVIALWAQAHARGFGSGWWATYRQWQEAGAQVKLGERASTIVFFKRVEADEEMEEVEASTRLIARASAVFNADQVSNWEAPKPAYLHSSAEAIESVETLVASAKAEIHHGAPLACYRTRDDWIEMPARAAFTGSPTCSATEAYYATLLHELVHWTGAKHRLDRGLGNGVGKDKLAAEELVAEIGAAYLCADLGVSNEPRPDHAAYVASWLKLLKDDKREIFTASRLADCAATFLLDVAAAAE